MSIRLDIYYEHLGGHRGFVSNVDVVACPPEPIQVFSGLIEYEVNTEFHGHQCAARFQQDRGREPVTVDLRGKRFTVEPVKGEPFLIVRRADLIEGVEIDLQLNHMPFRLIAEHQGYQYYQLESEKSTGEADNHAQGTGPAR